jgi:hypothetical protein
MAARYGTPIQPQIAESVPGRPEARWPGRPPLCTGNRERCRSGRGNLNLHGVVAVPLIGGEVGGLLGYYFRE